MKQFLKEMITFNYEANDPADFIKFLLMFISFVVSFLAASIAIGVYISPLLVPVVCVASWALVTYLTMKK